jgi:Domain of unknown function (DUF1992)
MTERKPHDVTFRSWIDQQISEAEERGAFDNLPGAGKPLPNRGDAENAWLIGWMRREGIATEELLPTPLRLRKQSSRLAGTVQELGSEQEVRDAVAELNHQIVEWRKIPTGPPIFVALVDAEAMVARWREAQASSAAPRTAPLPPAPAAGPSAAVRPDATSRRAWWRRRHSR